MKPSKVRTWIGTRRGKGEGDLRRRGEDRSKNEALEKWMSWGEVKRTVSAFGGLEVACWPLEPKFAGSNPAEAVGREVKLWVPCRKFTACKRSLNATWKSGIFRLNLPAIFRPHNSTFGC
jgi:hypothetical protein